MGPDAASAAPLEQIRAVAERVARSHGLEIFDLQLRRESIGWVLRIVIDRPAPAAAAGVTGGEEGVTVEDCQRVSHDVSAILDVEDPLDHAYTLEVSSPGLDRPLRGPDDYRRFVGRLAKIVVTEPIDGQKHLKGRLRGVDDKAVLLEVRGGRIAPVPLGTIARANLEVEF
jgi:ribosome maturation factor RimP